MIKFKVGPSAKLSAGSVGFGAFDGQERTCTKFEKAKGGVLRCAKFRKGRGNPVCDGRLVDGGRSPGLVRKVRCAKSPRKAARKARKARR